MAGKSKKKDKGPKKVRVRKPLKRWEMYTISGDKVERKNRSCPKCGEGVFMANHKNRYTCGKCGYTEFKKN